MSNFLNKIGEITGFIFAIACSLGLATGFLYWLFIAIQLGSFWMFFCAFIPPIAPFITVPVGIYMLFFGVPDWVINWFG